MLPQYEFAEGHHKNDTGYRTSPAPYGGTLPKGEGLFFSFYHSYASVAMTYPPFRPHRLCLEGGMAMAEQQFPHKLTLDERQQLTMTGVTEVVSFDETAVVLKTSLGLLTVQGQDLKLKTLSLEGGQVAVDGQIVALIYEEPREAGLWQRLWR